jgi:capsular polysaccharide biosynthesis protein
MKIKKSNIVLICLAIVFFANTAANYYIVVHKKIQEISEIVQSEKNNETPSEQENDTKSNN